MSRSSGLPHCRLVAYFSFLLAGLLCATSGCGKTPLRTPSTASGDTLRVATYNVNYGLAGDPETLAAVLGTDADIICLQETTPAWQLAIESELTSLPNDGGYPHRLFVHSRGAGGLAVLSRHALRSSGVVRGVDGWFPAWRFWAETPLGAVQFLSVHLRPPVSDSGSWVMGYFESDGVHAREVERFARDLQPGSPTLVLGDFNEEPGGAALQALAVRGMRSVLPEYAPDAVTWHWPTALWELTGMLDHIVYSGLAPISAEVLLLGRSDHYPVVAVFEATEP